MAGEVHKKIASLNIPADLDELEVLTNNLRDGDQITLVSVTAATFFIFPWIALGLGLLVHSAGKPEGDKIKIINQRLCSHFETLIAGIPGEWSIGELTSSNRVREMIGYLLSLNPTEFVLGKLVDYSADEMNIQFIQDICIPAGIVIKGDKLVLSAARIENESTTEYLQRMYGRFSNGVSRTLYGQTYTNSLTQATRTAASIPFVATEKVLGAVTTGGSYLYYGLKNTFGGKTGTAPINNDAADDDTTNTNSNNNSNTNSNNIVTSRSRSQSPSSRKK